MKSQALLAVLPLLATLPLPAAAHPHQAVPSTSSRVSSEAPVDRRHRKTLNFGPSHPHAFFDTPSSVDSATAIAGSKRGSVPEGVSVTSTIDAWQIARSTVEELLGGKESETYYIREDSYINERTQIAHIYIRQLVHGLEVADGDVNINVDLRTGKVRGFGSSFFVGTIPTADALTNLYVPSTISSSGTSAERVPSSQCSGLKDLIQTHQQYAATAKQLLVILEKGFKADTSAMLVAVESGLKLVGQILFGAESDIPSFTRTKDQIKKLIDDLGLKGSLEDVAGLRAEVADLLDSMERDVLVMEDHLPALCPQDVQSPLSLETVNVLQGMVEDQSMPFHPATHGILALLPAISQRPEDLPPLGDIMQNIKVHHAPTLLANNAPTEPPEEIITGLPESRAGGIEKGTVKARLMWQQVPRQSATTAGDEMELKLVWRYEIEMMDNWYEAYVDVLDLSVHRVVDWASDAPPSRSRSSKNGGKQKPLPVPAPTTPPYSYRVFPWGINDPGCGNLTLETEPWDKVASPAGWHAFPDLANPFSGTVVKGMEIGVDDALELNNSTSGNGTWTRFITTAGNNVFAHEDWEGQSNWLHNYRPINKSMIFDYEYGEPDGLRPKEYIDMAVTQLFYTSNMYHDLLYRLGFDEVSGNFQMENWDKGGKGGDAVIANAQDGSGYNNANFMTPPDGIQPRMRMYVWDTATPYRDGDIEAGIVIHEYSHGLSTRLTGGPANSGCLGYGEAGGMGEGWGDAMATFIRQIEEFSVNGTFAMGSWAANRDNGIRNYKYSSDVAINPSTYKTLDKPGYWGVHAIGEVWAEFLFVLEELLIAKHGFSSTLFPPLDPSKPNDYYRNVTTVDAVGKPIAPVPKHGNTLMVQLLVDAMKLQPCRPSFGQARDAIIQADAILTKGENTCLIWEAFASRGLGPKSELKGSLPWGGGVRVSDFEIPKLCLDKKKKRTE